MATPHMIKEQRGVTLLLAVLFLTASLSISLGIFYIVLVQLQINRSARDSHIAFYAADTIKECAAYYREYAGHKDDDADIDEAGYYRGFWSPRYPCADAGGDGSDCALPDNAPVCNGYDVKDFDYTAGVTDSSSHIFKFRLDPAGGLCADATIEVSESTDTTGVEDIKIITKVNGWSSCNAAQFRVNQSFEECMSHAGSCQ